MLSYWMLWIKLIIKYCVSCLITYILFQMKFAYINNDMYSTRRRNHFIVRLLGKVPIHAMKAYEGSGVITPFLNVGRSWTINITPWQLCPPVNNIGTPFRRRPRWAPQTVWTFRRRENPLLSLPGYGPWVVLTVDFFSLGIGVVAGAWSWPFISILCRG